MARTEHFNYLSADGLTQIHAIRWMPDAGEIRGVVQIAHGMQEFIDRYEEFADYLCAQGFVVTGNDHLGHGASIVSEEKYGYFAEHNGNRAVISDMRELHRQMIEQYPDVPYYMLGHSMGSFLARQYMCLYGNRLDGAIISGTAYHTALEANLGMTVCKLMAAFKGWGYRSPAVTKMAMGGYNRKFEPVRTRYDWLSRNEANVDSYRKDRRTQFMFTLNGFYNMFVGLKYLTRREHLARIPKDLPVLLIAGQMDPVGDYGNGVQRTALSLQQAGLRDVQVRLYPNDRHEVLNELDRQEVYADVLSWLNSHRPE